MSNNTTDRDTPQDDVGNGSDVTEIVPTSKPKSQGSSSDATQILPMRSAAQPTQELPGTVIGVAGAQTTGTGPSELTPPDRTADPNLAPDDEAATKILFGTPAQTSATGEAQSGAENVEPSVADSGEPQSNEPLTNLSEVADPPDEEITEPRDIPTPVAENTVFLAPVSKSKSQDDFNPPVGWLIIVDGPGRGAVLDIHYGQNTIGRGDEQHICLNFGDTQITRETHAYLLYDELERAFFLRDAGQKNLVRINKTPVMTPTKLNGHDSIQIGQTTCLFVPLCNDVFDWLGGEDDPSTGPAEEGKSE